jgi:hypothetical protein
VLHALLTSSSLTFRMNSKVNYVKIRNKIRNIVIFLSVHLTTWEVINNSTHRTNKTAREFLLTSLTI